MHDGPIRRMRNTRCSGKSEIMKLMDRKSGTKTKRQKWLWECGTFHSNVSDGPMAGRRMVARPIQFNKFLARLARPVQGASGSRQNTGTLGVVVLKTKPHQWLLQFPSLWYNSSVGYKLAREWTCYHLPLQSQPPPRGHNYDIKLSPNQFNLHNKGRGGIIENVTNRILDYTLLFNFNTHYRPILHSLGTVWIVDETNTVQAFHKAKCYQNINLTIGYDILCASQLSQPGIPK